MPGINSGLTVPKFRLAPLKLRIHRGAITTSPTRAPINTTNQLNLPVLMPRIRQRNRRSSRNRGTIARARPNPTGHLIIRLTVLTLRRIIATRRNQPTQRTQTGRPRILHTRPTQLGQRSKIRPILIPLITIPNANSIPLIRLTIKLPRLMVVRPATRGQLPLTRHPDRPIRT